jgi:hypothetical protein
MRKKERLQSLYVRLKRIQINLGTATDCAKRELYVQDSNGKKAQSKKNDVRLATNNKISNDK